MGPIASSGVSILKFLRNHISTYDFPGESRPQGVLFIHTLYVGSGHFFFVLVQNFEFQYFWGFQNGV